MGKQAWTLDLALGAALLGAAATACSAGGGPVTGSGGTDDGTGGVYHPPTGGSGGGYHPPTGGTGGYTPPPTGGTGGGAPPTGGTGGYTPPPTGGTGGYTPPPTGGTGGSPPPTGTCWNFDSGAQNFSIVFQDPTTLGATATYDGSTGDPASGSMSVSAPFSAVNQKFDLGTAPVTPLNLSSRMLTARVRLDSGLGTTDAPGGAKVYIKTGTGFIYASSPWTNLDTAGTWVTLTLNVAAPAYVQPGSYNPTQVTELGVEIATGGTGTFTAATLHVDSICY